MNERRGPAAGTDRPPGPKSSSRAKSTAAPAGKPKRTKRRAGAAQETVDDEAEQGVLSASARAIVSPRTISTAASSRTVPQRPRSPEHDGAADAKKGKKRVLKLLNGLLTLFVATLLAFGGTAYYMQAAVDAEGPLKEPRLLVIPRNDGTQQIADRLEKDGIVGDRHIFLAGLYALRLASLTPGGRTISLKAGEYEIKPGASIRTLIDTMSEGRSVLMRVTVPEGLTSWQIIERLKAEQGLSGDVREVPAEGTLLPETYSLPRGSSRQTLVEMMQAAQKKLVDQLWAERQDGLPLKSPAEALVLASIIEKETGRNDERDRVASVFVNRLRRGMKIQSDPTILYGLALGKVQWGKPILRSEIASKTAHNTYAIAGLPPTPICNPGRAALEATLKPAAGNDLFFVADGRGGHVFSETNRDHEANVAKWRQVERERAAVAAGAAAAAAPQAAPTPVTTINSPTSKAGASTLAPQGQKKP